MLACSEVRSGICSMTKAEANLALRKKWSSAMQTAIDPRQKEKFVEEFMQEQKAVLQVRSIRKHHLSCPQKTNKYLSFPPEIKTHKILTWTDTHCVLFSCLLIRARWTPSCYMQLGYQAFLAATYITENRYPQYTHIIARIFLWLKASNHWKYFILRQNRKSDMPNSPPGRLPVSRVQS